MTREDLEEFYEERSAILQHDGGWPLFNFEIDAYTNRSELARDGKVRNFLCRRCNSVLGLVNDDGLLLRKFMRYIKENAQ